ncbi:unnamed protein product [Schistocephalus solidus]|uniref:Integrase catalytic domain-containing protein n=1 Tax=Schistocephalus solidus TaxID=70667 RepID=A0A183TB11_SCHSO|nr:unnamed protein product [Schistocephalus solidus]
MIFDGITSDSEQQACSREANPPGGRGDYCCERYQLRYSPIASLRLYRCLVDSAAQCLPTANTAAPYMSLFPLELVSSFAMFLQSLNISWSQQLQISISFMGKPTLECGRQGNYSLVDLFDQHQSGCAALDPNLSSRSAGQNSSVYRSPECTFATPDVCFSHTHPSIWWVFSHFQTVLRICVDRFNPFCAHFGYQCETVMKAFQAHGMSNFDVAPVKTDPGSQFESTLFYQLTSLSDTIRI